VLVETDHKPLVSIMSKSIDKAPKRLQDMIMILRKYDLELRYKKGSELFIADALSRAFLEHHDGADADTPQYEVMNIVNLSPRRITQLQDNIQSDIEYQQLLITVTGGWPRHIRSVPIALKEYFNIRDELSENEGLVFRGNRTVIPKQLRAEYMDILHAGHPGVEAMRLRAKNMIYLPGISADIAKLASSCSTCNKYHTRQQREPLKLHKVPTRPWQIVASDLFTWNNKEHLIIIDSYSGWFEINTLTSTSSDMVIRKMSSHFARYGSPEILLSDNGPQYSSAAFSKFSDKWGFKHITSSPKYPQSNGLAERAVRTAKNILQKAMDSSTDPYVALLHYRNTPRDSGLESPAQRFMSRMLRTQLPTVSEELEPRHDNMRVHQKLKARRNKQKVHYDRRAQRKEMSVLPEGTVVRLFDGQHHDKLGVVTKQCQEPRSYIVDTDNGAYRRNRRDMIPVNEPMPVPDIPCDIPHVPVSVPGVRSQSEAQSVPQEESVTQEESVKGSVKQAVSPSETVPIRRNPLRERKRPEKFKDYV